MRLQKRDTYDSFDSAEHVCGRRWHEQNRDVSISFSQENVWECRLFRVNTTTHGHIDGVARDPESEHLFPKAFLVQYDAGQSSIYDKPNRMTLHLNFENWAL
jgi:hypothetical protein